MEPNIQQLSVPAFIRAIACQFHSIAAICAFLSVSSITATVPLELRRETRAEDQDAPETWMTCGTTLCPFIPPLPPPTLSNSTSAAQVMLVRVPCATRTTQRFVTEHKCLTVPHHQKKRSAPSQSKKTGGRRRKSSPASDAELLPSRHLQNAVARSASAH
jgi:hypothetical protein